MAFHGQYNDFGHESFPPIPDQANEETKMCELYPERIQDEVNEYYTHDKVLYREEGTDFVSDDVVATDKTPETVSTFPNVYPK